MNDLEGRVAVVTGGSTGIGRAVVDRFVAGGASVVYCSHDPRTLDPGVDGPHGRGRSMIGVIADVRSPTDMRSLMARAVDSYGGLDVLVCSAGIQTYGTAEDTTEEDWQAVLDTNLSGIFRAAKFAIPHLRARGGGSIVTVSSVQGRTPGRRVLGYSVSKAAIDALTRSMAVDHAVDGIRVNTVAPGPVDTPLLRVSDPAATPNTALTNVEDRQVVRGSGPVLTALHSPEPLPPTPRVAQPSEVAEVIAFLASSRASYVTGATYFVDGGMAASQGGVLLT